MRMAVCGMLLFFIAGLAQAGVNKCTGSDGKITFSDGLCPLTANSERVRERDNSLDHSGGRQQTQNALGAVENSAACQSLMRLADNTYSSFLENTNPNRWGVAFKSLESLANSCQTKDVCELIKARVGDAQARYSESSTSFRGSQLNSVTTLYAQSCRGSAPRNNTQTTDSTSSPDGPKNHYWTKDQFGTTVRSDRCYWTKDASGNSVKSAACK